MSKSKKNEVTKSLSQFRKKIDKVDKKIIQLLEARFATVEKVGKVKRKHQLPIYQKARWDEVVKDRLKTAEMSGINPAFMRSFLKILHQEAIRIQRGKK